MDLNLRIAGQAGQGVQSAGDLLVGAFASMGLHVFSTKSYMSRIRGGLNWYDIRIADFELFAGLEIADVLVALSPMAAEILGTQISQRGMVLLDADEADDAIAISFTKSAAEVAGVKLMANSVAAGAVFALLGYPPDALHQHLRKTFKKKGDEVIDKNISCAVRGSELIAGQAGQLPGPTVTGAPSTLLCGADAIGQAAAVAGVKLVAAYPMTPGTATFTYLAGVADRYGIVVEQVEDEISAVNMACGSTYAGAATLVCTSGGGFALMVEGLSLAGMLELPLFIVIAQRPGPATGLPTRTAQQDLSFALTAGHGEFPRAIFAPGTQQQCYDQTRRALVTAHKFQTPVILLTDQFLQDAQKNIPAPPDQPDPIDRAIATNAGDDYLRYALTESGVSPRAIPGGEALVVSDSDEHTADGHLTEDLDVHLAQHDKRMRKLAGMKAEAVMPEFYGPADAETLLLCWGSTYGPCREAIDTIGKKKGGAAMLHFSQLWPLNVEAVGPLLASARRIVCVEGNSTGQLASLLRQCGLIGDAELLLRYDGLAFTADYIIQRLGG